METTHLKAPDLLNVHLQGRVRITCGCVISAGDSSQLEDKRTRGKITDSASATAGPPFRIQGAAGGWRGGTFIGCCLPWKPPFLSLLLVTYGSGNEWRGGC